MTRKMNNVTTVHIIFWLKGILRSGAATSGKNGVNGFTRSKKRTVTINQWLWMLVFDKGLNKVPKAYLQTLCNNGDKNRKDWEEKNRNGYQIYTEENKMKETKIKGSNRYYFNKKNEKVVDVSWSTEISRSCWTAEVHVMHWHVDETMLNKHIN